MGTIFCLIRSLDPAALFFKGQSQQGKKKKNGVKKIENVELELDTISLFS